MAPSDDEQQFCLRWNNFQKNITSQFETLRDDEDFVDVTIACDKRTFGAHKVVLSACSPFFKQLFKRNPCTHPIIFMRDVSSKDVEALLEFMYAGEVNVAQANLAGFLRTAESLQIRGLTETTKNQKDDTRELEEKNDKIVTSNQNSSPEKIVKQVDHPQPVKETYIAPQQIDAEVHDNKRPATGNSQIPLKRICKTENDDNQNSKTQYDMRESPTSQTRYELHPTTEIDADLKCDNMLEPKLEPDYESDNGMDKSMDESMMGFEGNDAGNIFGSMTGAGDSLASGSMVDLTQDSNPGQISSNYDQWNFFNEFDSHKQHFLRHQFENEQITKPGTFQCKHCDQILSSSGNLYKHIFRKHNSKDTVVQCDICKIKFKDKYNLRDHLRERHGFTNKQT